MSALGQPLNEHPQTQIDRIRWRSSIDPTAPVDDQERANTTETNQSVQTSPQFSHYDIAVVDAYLTEFNGNYREAIEVVDDFARILREQINAHSVEVLRYPLDTESGANLTGLAVNNDAAPEARFSLKIILGVPDVRKET